MHPKLGALKSAACFWIPAGPKVLPFSLESYPFLLADVSSQEHSCLLFSRLHGVRSLDHTAARADGAGL